MNNRLRLRRRYLKYMPESIYQQLFVDNEPWRYLKIESRLDSEFVYLKHANKSMRETNYFGLPHRKEFEKRIKEGRLV